MKTYTKGTRAERELLHFLNFHGFACLRQASSGGYLTPVDIVAMKKGRILAIECKAHKKKPKLQKDKLKRFAEWCEKADAFGLLAWRTTGKWLFLRLKDAEKGNYELENWIEMEDLLKVFGI